MKKLYIAPHTMQVKLALESIMITASPGVGGDYDPSGPIDAKSNTFFDDEAEEEAGWMN